MNNKLLHTWLLVVMALIMSVSLSACGDDEDEPANNSTEAISGTYIGDFNMIGLTDDNAERAYVELTRKSSSSVSCKIESEGWKVDMDPVNLSVTFSGETVILRSETSKAISGQIINGHLQLTYETSQSRVFQFIGTKD